jgi:hypothetical protein
MSERKESILDRIYELFYSSNTISKIINPTTVNLLIILVFVYLLTRQILKYKEDSKILFDTGYFKIKTKFFFK